MFLDEPRYPVQARTTQASRVSAIEVTAFLNIMRVSFATSLSVFARMNERIQAHWDAGADHVCLQAFRPDGAPGPDEALLEELAPNRG